MLSLTQIQRIDKICGTTWDFQVFEDSEFVGASLQYLAKGLTRHNVFEFSKDETVDLQTFAKAVRQRAEDFDADEEAYIRFRDLQDQNSCLYPSRELLNLASRLGTAWKSLAAKLSRYANLK